WADLGQDPMVHGRLRLPAGTGAARGVRRMATHTRRRPHDEAGYLYFVGRMDDCVKTGAGYLVNMAEVASVLADHPAVMAAEVVSIDGGSGPVLGAILESAGNPSADEIRDYATRRLPPSSRPRVIRFIDQLPRLPGGKVDRLAC